MSLYIAIPVYPQSTRIRPSDVKEHFARRRELSSSAPHQPNGCMKCYLGSFQYFCQTRNSISHRSHREEINGCSLATTMPGGIHEEESKEAQQSVVEGQTVHSTTGMDVSNRTDCCSHSVVWTTQADVWVIPLVQSLPALDQHFLFEKSRALQSHQFLVSAAESAPLWQLLFGLSSWCIDIVRNPCQQSCCVLRMCTSRLSIVSFINTVRGTSHV
jgi:hypothetical protein